MKIKTSEFTPYYRDRQSSDLVSFPFAFIAFITLGAGILAFATSTIVMSASLAIAGIILIFTGSTLYGASLCGQP